MAGSALMRGYNNLSQYRKDTWSALEEATERLAAAAGGGRPVDAHLAAVSELMNRLSPVERYFAFPGPQALVAGRRLFTAGKYTRFARAVASANRALVTDAFRNGVDWSMAAAIAEPMESTGQLPESPVHQRPYFEVLVVEDMTEAQERSLPEELRGWRRPDDEFIDEIVVVPSYEDAVIAVRINTSLQACVIKRRFTHHAGRDLSALAKFVDDRSPDDLMEQSVDQRAESLGSAIRDIRPELDLFLLTEISLEDVAGSLGHQFRRIFHSREGTLELHLSLLSGVAERYRAPFFNALQKYSHRPTGVFHALPISQGKSIVNSHWIRDMIDFYGLGVFLPETSATCGGLDSLLEPTGPLRDALDLGRRQAALEGFELVQKQVEYAMRLRDAVDNHPLLRQYMRCLTTADLIPAEFRPSGIDQPLRSGIKNMQTAWGSDEFVIDPCRVTIYIGATGIDGDTFKRTHLMDKHGVQINNTPRNSVLFMTNIGTTRSSVAYLIEVLVKIARELEEKHSEMSLNERALHETAVRRLTNPAAPLPDFSSFHAAFRTDDGSNTPEGDVRRAFFLSYDDSLCEYLPPGQIQEKLAARLDVVSARFVTPYPPGFPVLVPGQMFSQRILDYMGSLDTSEAHGLRADRGYRVYTDKAPGNRAGIPHPLMRRGFPPTRTRG